MGRKDQELPLGTTLGNALRDLIASRFKHNAAKQIERRWDLDPKTAKNVVQRGHVSERTLTKAALAERWELWMALGEELFGETYHDAEERRLQSIISKATDDLHKVRRLSASAPVFRQEPVDVDQALRMAGGEGDDPPGGRGRRKAG